MVMRQNMGVSVRNRQTAERAARHGFEGFDNANGRMSDSYFFYEGEFLHYGNNTCRAKRVPDLKLETTSIYYHCKEHPEDLPLVRCWVDLMDVVTRVRPDACIALDFWDLSDHQLCMLIKMLSTLDEIVPEEEPLEVDRQADLNSELMSQECYQHCVDLSPSVPALITEAELDDNSSLMEVAAHAFLNYSSDQLIEDVLNCKLIDPEDITNMKVSMIKEAVKDGIVNPEITALIFGGDTESLSKLFNDGYPHEIRRVNTLNRSELPTIRPFRTRFSVLSVPNLKLAPAREVRIAIMFAGIVKGSIKLGQPVFHIRDQWNSGIEIVDSCYPLFSTIDRIDRHGRTINIMTVWCCSATPTPLFENNGLTLYQRTLFKYVYAQMVKRGASEFGGPHRSLSVDTIRHLYELLEPKEFYRGSDDVVHLSSTCRQLRNIWDDHYYGDSTGPYRGISYLNDLICSTTLQKRGWWITRNSIETRVIHHSDLSFARNYEKTLKRVEDRDIRFFKKNEAHFRIGYGPSLTDFPTDLARRGFLPGDVDIYIDFALRDVYLLDDIFNFDYIDKTSTAAVSRANDPHNNGYFVSRTKTTMPTSNDFIMWKSILDDTLD